MVLNEKLYERLSAADRSGETAFVQACLKRYFGQHAGGVADDTAGLSQQAVYDIVRLNKVGNFIFKALPILPDADRLGDLAGLLDAYRRQTVALNSSCLMDSRAVREALDAADIDFVFLKGPMQQKLLYGDLFMKPSGDIDVLVSQADFTRSREALRSIGYEVSSKSRSRWWIHFLGEQHLAATPPRRATVDLHYRLQQPGSPSPRDIAAFLSRRQRIAMAGEGMPLISAPDMLLLSCISVAKAFYNREACAGYVCDVRAGVNAMDEAGQRALIMRAEGEGLGSTLLLGIRAADLILGSAGGGLSDRARHVLPGIGDEDLSNMVIAPWLPSIRWPYRRSMLWELCGRSPPQYLAEAGWAVAAEIGRRIFERPAQGEQAEGTTSSEGASRRRHQPPVGTSDAVERQDVSVEKNAVCVIVAAHNAAKTIAVAIASALREPEVAEVVVVDDASGDNTAAVARAADDGSGRLAVIRLEANRGPSHARNLAIERSRSPFVSILDADDFFFEGRFRRMFADADFDFAADNIMFVVEGAVADVSKIAMPRLKIEPKALALESFVEGNISRRGAQRGELGFLKPVISRAFLDKHGLRYDEKLRLGEDYELYARALASGARFKVTPSCGYGAIVRADSLSGRHRAEDLRRLADADLALLSIERLSQSAKAALRRHERHIRGKYRLRHFLDIKAGRGITAAAAYALASPSHFLPIVLGVIMDKYGAALRGAGLASSPQIQPPTRFLLAGSSAADES